jgi:uncharacterized protein YndB with AHSA1/START domain
MAKAIVTAEAGKQEILITREFDAPRELVFKAYTDPELVPQWWGPAKYTTIIEKFDPRSGGEWKIMQKGPDGEFGFHGVLHEVTAPERIIQTFEFDGLPEKGHVCLETASFEDLPEGRSRVVAQSVFQSVTDRDGMVQSGMESGVQEGYDRLDTILETLKKGN